MSEIKSGYSYFVHHVPTNEDWYLLGIDVKSNRVCAAGWPQTIGALSDCINLEVNEPLTEKEGAICNVEPKGFERYNFKTNA